MQDLTQAVEFLEGYSTGKSLAKDLCWAMCLAPSCHNVTVYEVKDYGWMVDCDCDDKKMALSQIHSILKKRYFNVNWL